MSVSTVMGLNSWSKKLLQDGGARVINPDTTGHPSADMFLAAIKIFNGGPSLEKDPFQSTHHRLSDDRIVIEVHVPCGWCVDPEQYIRIDARWSALVDTEGQWITESLWTPGEIYNFLTKERDEEIKFLRKIHNPK